MKRAGNAPLFQKSPQIDYLHVCKVHFVKEICFVYTDDDKPEMTMLKQIDFKVTKPQNKHGHGRTRKCPILSH